MLFALSMVVAGSAAAQQRAVPELDARFSALQAQRNSALDNVVILQGRVVALQNELDKAKTECKAAEKKPAEKKAEPKK